MKRLQILLIFAITMLVSAILPSKDAHATHAAGGEIIYVHISDSTYQFFFKFYRDCTGIDAPPTVDLCFEESCSNQTFTRVMTKWNGKLPPDNRDNGDPVSLGCSNSENYCTDPNSDIPGYREWWYSWIETLPIACNTWTFGVSISARNYSYNLSTSGNLYVETTFNSGVTWDNSSPYFSVKPIPYVCKDAPYSYNNGALDADGDSLWSEIAIPLIATTCVGTPNQSTLNANLSPPITVPANPLQTNNQFNLNGANGQMNFTATMLGAATLTMRTREFRNGVELGYIMRDVQVQILECTASAPGVTTIAINGGDTTGGVNYGCVGQNLNFCFDVTASDPDAVLILEDNLQTAIPGAAMNYTNQKTDQVTACFSWTPGLADVGAQSFILTIKDSTCEPPGILLQYAEVVDLYIWGPIEATPDTNICNGQPAFIGVSGGGNYEWSVVSGTPGSVVPTNSPAPVATPSTTTVYAVESKANTYCPNLNKDTVTVVVEQGPEVLGQADTTTCPDNPTPLDIKVVKQPGASYSVQWSPATGLDNPNIEKPTATLKNDVTYNVIIGSNTNKCLTYDTVVVNVLDGFNIINPDTAICSGSLVSIRAEGDVNYNYLWTSPSGNKNDPNVSFTQPSNLTTNIIPSDTGVFVYELTASYTSPGGAQCPDSSARIEITVEPNPTLQVNDDAELCFGDTLTLKGRVQPDTYNGYVYNWTPGASLDYPDRANAIYTANVEGVNTIKLVVSTAKASCSDSDDVELTVYPASFLNVPSDTAICPGDSIILALDVTDGVQYYWAPDFNISNISSQQPAVWPVADQVYTVYGKDTTGCLDTNEIYVAVRPRAVVDLPDSVTIYPGESYRMDPGGNALYYTWFPPLGLSNADVADPTVSPVVNTRYIVQARTEAGCMVSDSINVIVKNDSYIELPNAFTPGSRTNGTFRILNRGTIDLKRFAVYNRWGTKVFETSDVTEGWNGTLDGEIQPMGVYIYTVEAITPSGRTVNKQGNVTLIR